MVKKMVLVEFANYYYYNRNLTKITFEILKRCESIIEDMSLE